MHTLTEPAYKPPYVDRLLNLDEVLTKTGMSRATLYRRINEGCFPQPVKIGRASRWPISEVRQFVEACKQARFIHTRLHGAPAETFHGSRPSDPLELVDGAPK